MTDVHAEMTRRTRQAARQWGSEGVGAVVDAAEAYDVDRYLEGRRRILLTKAQAAEALAISVRKLESLVAAGDIAPTRIGRSIRFAPAVLDAFVTRNTATGIDLAPDVLPLPTQPPRRGGGGRRRRTA